MIGSWQHPSARMDQFTIRIAEPIEILNPEDHLTVMLQFFLQWAKELPIGILAPLASLFEMEASDKGAERL